MAASATAGVFRRADGRVLVDCEFLDIYVPDEYFDVGIARVAGEKLETIGIFEFRAWDGKSPSEVKFRMNIPGTLSLTFDSVRPGRVGDDVCRIFTLSRGDVFMESENVVSSPKNLEAFAKLLHSGHLPKTTYEAIYRQYVQVQVDNATSLNVPSSTIEGIIAELARDEKDMGRPFRMALAEGAPDTGFRLAPLRMIPALTSTFSGVAFENIGAAIRSGIVRKRTGGKEPVTAMEETIKY